MTTRYKRSIRRRISDFTYNVRYWWFYHSDSFLGGVATGAFSVVVAYLIVVSI